MLFKTKEGLETVFKEGNKQIINFKVVELTRAMLREELKQKQIEEAKLLREQNREAKKQKKKEKKKLRKKRKKLKKAFEKMLGEDFKKKLGIFDFLIFLFR